jgi:hypothetical protein
MICASCKCQLTNASWVSKLRSRVQYYLCPPCGKEENILIDDAGTNDLPEEVEYYADNLLDHYGEVG